MNKEPAIGIIGGSGLYELDELEKIEKISVNTPFGKPSSPIITGNLSGKKVAFLARHGIGHFLSPTEVNYQANIYAFKSLGIKQIISVSACGSLRKDFEPGHIVIPDQIVDFTKDRKRSFFGEGIVAHIGSADPFCKTLSKKLFESVINAKGTVHSKGIFITIEGPRFSTRAESNLFRLWGMDIIGMTASPEAFLAREAEMCYACMAHVTDYDVWHFSKEPVSVEMVIKTLNKNTAIAKTAIQDLVKSLPLEIEDCECQHTLKDAIMTDPELIKQSPNNKFNLLLGKI
ncbi:MAG: S-methyl-5'-thioadenosine phosphorylase [Anaerolineaceae bacterium]|nr:S-methyl-5'-thioadenosine phosphorylase [Anaerolineaceae bacterium]